MGIMVIFFIVGNAGLTSSTELLRHYNPVLPTGSLVFPFWDYLIGF